MRPKYKNKDVAPMAHSRLSKKRERMDHCFVHGETDPKRFLGEKNEKNIFVISGQNMQIFMPDTLGPWAELKFQISSKSHQ